MGETTVNKQALETFWYWISERHHIFLAKERGELWPWTDDPILQEWKFCNPFRNNDKQTRWLFEHVYSIEDLLPELIIFNTYAFRAFNLYETFQAIAPKEGYFYYWDKEATQDLLAYRVGSEQQLTSGAYMIRGREGMPKHQSIVKTLDSIWRARTSMANTIHQESRESLQETHKYLMDLGFWGWGPFTTYQIVLDLYNTSILDPLDINTWCEFGPGAERGIRLIYPELKRKDFIPATTELFNMQGMYLKDYVPFMNLQDIEFSLCELSKYWRIKQGGKSKERYHGKSVQ